MGPPPDVPLPPTTPEILLYYVRVDRIVQHMLHAALALLVWDHLLTFSREVEYVWKGGRWTVIKALFLFTRYATLVVVAGNAWSEQPRGGSCSYGTLALIEFPVDGLLDYMRSGVVPAPPSSPSSSHGSSPLQPQPSSSSSSSTALDAHLWLQWIPDALLHALMLGIILWKAFATPRSSQTPMLGLLYRDGIVYYSTTLVILVGGILIWRFADLAWIGVPLYVGWVLCQIAMSRLLLSLRSVSAFTARMVVSASRHHHHHHHRHHQDETSRRRIGRRYAMTPASASVDSYYYDGSESAGSGAGAGGYALETFARSGTVLSTRSTTTNVSNEDGATLVHHESYVYGMMKSSDGGGAKREQTLSPTTARRALSPLGGGGGSSSSHYEHDERWRAKSPPLVGAVGSSRMGAAGYPSLSTGVRRLDSVEDYDRHQYHHQPQQPYHLNDSVRRIASRVEWGEEEEDMMRARTRAGHFGTPVPPRQRLVHLWWWLLGREVRVGGEDGDELLDGVVDGSTASSFSAGRRTPGRWTRTKRGVGVVVVPVVRDARVCVDADEVERWDPEDDRGPGVKDSRLG
ncbi:hypothetical protein FRC17_005187, partial [Serendipita sp. 399]